MANTILGRTAIEIDADLILKANQDTTYTKTEVDNKFSTLETNIDWKESVATFSDISITYPNPIDGWTVNTRDTDYTYRYNGTAWIAISANAIPKATQSLDGLMAKEDKVKVDNIDSNLALKQDKTDNNLQTVEKNIVPAINEVKSTVIQNDLATQIALNLLQPKTDNTLVTTSKTISGAINEVKSLTDTKTPRQDAPNAFLGTGAGSSITLTDVQADTNFGNVTVNGLTTETKPTLTFTANDITTTGADFPFAVDDDITITGCTVNTANNQTNVHLYAKLNAKNLHFVGEPFIAGVETADITITNGTITYSTAKSPTQPTIITGMENPTVTVTKGITPVTYPIATTSPLYSFPNGTDKIDIVSGLRTNNVDKFTVLATTMWPYLNSTGYTNGGHYQYYSSVVAKIKGAGICNLFNNKPGYKSAINGITFVAGSGLIISIDDATIGVVEGDTNAQRTEKFNNWFHTFAPLDILFPTSNPTTSQGTPLTIPAYAPTTTISTDKSTLSVGYNRESNAVLATMGDCKLLIGTFATRPTTVIYKTLYIATDKAIGNADRLTVNNIGSTWLQI